MRGGPQTTQDPDEDKRPKCLTSACAEERWEQGEDEIKGGGGVKERVTILLGDNITIPCRRRAPPPTIN